MSLSSHLAALDARLAEIDAALDATGLSRGEWYRLTAEKTRVLDERNTVARALKFGGGCGLEVYQPNYACKADDLTHGLPIAFSVRKDATGRVVTEHGRQIRITEDGRKTTLGGRAIIDSKEQREAHKKHWGLEED